MKEMIIIRRPRLFIFLLCAFMLPGQLLLCGGNEKSADTTEITLKKAEEIFGRENLQLIAAKYNIKISDAQILQTKLWSNPNISIEQNVYNQTTHRFMDFTGSGNTDVSLQQLFLLAGKRDKQTKIAEINKQANEFTFYDLLSSLKYQLRVNFYDLYFLQQSLKFYNESIPKIEETITVVEKAYEKRSMLLSDVIRLKSLLVTLQNEKLSIINQIDDMESNFAVFFNDKSEKYYVHVMSAQMFDSLSVEVLKADSLLEIAYENRPDLKISKNAIKLDEANITLQKSLAVPDLTVSARFSRQGSYITDYYALAVSIDLPFFNRNQGNIEASQITLKQDEINNMQVKNNIRKDVIASYYKAVETDKLYKQLDKKFTAQYQALAAGMVSNFKQKYATIIEFTDFFESYRASILELNQLQNNRIDSFETLNYKTGRDVLLPATSN